MRRCSPSYVLRKLQIKTMSYCYTLTKMAKIQNIDNIKCWQGCLGSEISPLSLVEIQNGTTTLEDNLAVSYKTKYTLGN